MCVFFVVVVSTCYVPRTFVCTGIKVDSICLSLKSLQFVYYLMVKCPSQLTECCEVWHELIHLLIQYISVLSSTLCSAFGLGSHDSHNGELLL